jgi:hypothetical protein
MIFALMVMILFGGFSVLCAVIGFGATIAEGTVIGIAVALVSFMSFGFGQKEAEIYYTRERDERRNSNR